MNRLITAELLKLRSTRMYLGLLAAASGLVVVVTFLQFLLAGDPALDPGGAAGPISSEADLRALLDVSGVTVLFTLILGATAISGEARHQTIASTFLITPRRTRVIAAKVIAYIIAGALFGLIVEAAAAAVAFGWLALAGTPIPFGASVGAGLALNPVATGLAAGLGVGVGAIVPNQLGAVLVSIGWVMIVEQLVSGVLPGLVPWLPFAGAGSAVTGEHSSLGSGGGVALFSLYLLTVVVVGSLLTRQRDVA